jgi:hypothetical protein
MAFCLTLKYGADLGKISLPMRSEGLKLNQVKLLLDNLPAAMQSQRQTLAQCFEAMDRALPLRAVYLFGSHARGEARTDSDVDLCIIADGAERQSEAARQWRRAMRPVWPRPAFTLLPISPSRLAEKQASRDHFFQTVFKEGVLLATEN